MNRRTRELVTSGTDQSDLTGGNATWQTPPAVFLKLHDEFGFDIDLFADAERALHDVWFGPGSARAEDALAAKWSAYGGTGFWNPPYGRFLKRVLQKAEIEARMGFRSVGLIPLRMTRPLRAALFDSATVEQWLFPNKRITFYENGAPRLDAQGRPMPAVFDSTIVVFGPHARCQPLVAEWRVPKH